MSGLFEIEMVRFFWIPVAALLLIMVSSFTVIRLQKQLEESDKKYEALKKRHEEIKDFLKTFAEQSHKGNTSIRKLFEHVIDTDAQIIECLNGIQKQLEIRLPTSPPPPPPDSGGMTKKGI